MPDVTSAPSEARMPIVSTSTHPRYCGMPSQFKLRTCLQCPPGAMALAGFNAHRVPWHLPDSMPTGCHGTCWIQCPPGAMAFAGFALPGDRSRGIRLGDKKSTLAVIATSCWTILSSAALPCLRSTETADRWLSESDVLLLPLL